MVPKTLSSPIFQGTPASVRVPSVSSPHQKSGPSGGRVHSQTKTPASVVINPYLPRPARPIGKSHRHASFTANQTSFTVPVGMYLLIHDDGRIETFPVSRDVENCDRIQWIDEAGVWKAVGQKGCLFDFGGKCRARVLVLLCFCASVQLGFITNCSCCDDTGLCVGASRIFSGR